MDWILRPFRMGDEGRLVTLWNRTLLRDPITVELFRRQTLAPARFHADGCVLAEAGQDIVGLVLTMAAPGAAGARIVGLAVLPELRRKGIGSALLNAAVAFAKQRGCSRMSVAAHEYYAAGVDQDAYADGLSFLLHRGFEQVNQAVAMGRELYDLEWPVEVWTAQETLRKAGIEVRYFDPRYTAALLDYFQAEFPDWVEFFKRKLQAGHDFDEIVIATDGTKVVGYCQHLDTDHVGPFGVAAAYRSRGIGSVMLYRLLERMRQKGFRFCWFGETGKAKPYYERAGFHVTRRYSILRRDL